MARSKRGFRRLPQSTCCSHLSLYPTVILGAAELVHSFTDRNGTCDVFSIEVGDLAKEYVQIRRRHNVSDRNRKWFISRKIETEIE